MGLGFRYFLLDAGDQLWAIPRRLLENLVHGLDRLPQYADQSLKVITAYLDLVDGKPVHLAQVSGSLWHFDSRGSIQLALRSDEHTSELPSLMLLTYDVFCLKPT